MHTPKTARLVATLAWLAVLMTQGCVGEIGGPLDGLPGYAADGSVGPESSLPSPSPRPDDDSAAGETDADATPGNADAAGEPSELDATIAADAAPVPDATAIADALPAEADQGASAFEPGPPDGEPPSQDGGGGASADATPAPDASADAPGDAAPAACLVADLAARMGIDRPLMGGNIDDPQWGAAPFDLRYRYLANDVPAEGTCDSCATNCPAADTWWGCWQSKDDPPGRYVVKHVQDTEAAGAVPMLTYYTWFSVAGSVEGEAEIAALAEGPRVARYLADWRFACQKIDEATTGPVILHAEPDLWGFGEKSNADPEAIAAAVSSAGAPECADEPDTMAGLARCMLHIARAEAPSAIVAFHASGWGAGHDALQDTNPQFDVDDHAARTAAFMTALGAAQADLVVVEMSDRDAGYDGHWWDASNASVPNFHRAEHWASKVASGMGLPHLWWQVPFGNTALPGGCHQYADNRLDYFFDHAQDFAADGSLGIAFGAGSSSCGTTASTDAGHFVERAGTFLGGDRPCFCNACP